MIRGFFLVAIVGGFVFWLMFWMDGLDFFFSIFFFSASHDWLLLFLHLLFWLLVSFSGFALEE